MLKIFALLLSNFIAVFALADGIAAPVYAIQKDGQTSYLLGTIHTGVNYGELPEAIRQKADAANTLVIEADLAAAQSLIPQALPLGAENSLKEQLTPAEWEKLYAAVAPLMGENAKIINRLNPVVATILFSMTGFEAAAGPTSEPIDQTLFKLAQENGKQIQFMEDAQAQIDLLINTMGISALKEALASSGDADPAKGTDLKDTAEMLLKAYRTGDLVALEAAVMEGMTAEDLQITLIDRNLNWMKKFDQIFGTPGTEFIAVGAAHLVGEYGLLRLLAARGYGVTRL